MSRYVTRYIVLLAAVALSGGCLSMSTSTEKVPTKELVSTDFVGEHSVRYLLEEAGTETVSEGGSSNEDESASQQMMSSEDDDDEETETETIRYYNLYVEVCDIGANNAENNCKKSKILDRIVRHNRQGEQSRQVTDMFWNSSDTLFISYLAPKPAVKSCQVTDSNTLRCADQPGINDILNQKKVFKTDVTTK